MCIDKMNNDRSEQAIFPNGGIFDLISTNNATIENTSNNSKVKDKGTTRSLPIGYSPGPKDVVCGRGRFCFNHEGNRNFRRIVDTFVPEYISTNNKFDKSIIISAIVDCIRTSGGEFVRQDRVHGTYYKVGNFVAREKTSQTFRDVISRQNKPPENSQQQKEDMDTCDQCNKISTCYENHQNDLSNHFSLPFNQNSIDSTYLLPYKTIIPSSFWKNNDNEKDDHSILNHDSSSTLVKFEDDEFDKMIDEVIRPLPHKIQNYKYDNMINDVIRPISREMQNDYDLLCDTNNCCSSPMSSCECIDWKAFLNEKSEASCEGIIPSSQQDNEIFFFLLNNNELNNIATTFLNQNCNQENIYNTSVDFLNIFDDDNGQPF